MVKLYDFYKKQALELKSDLEAREICAFALKMDRNSISEWKNTLITTEDASKIMRFVNMRKKGKPLAYILGEWEFFSLPFFVNENVLIPRPDTETLVEEIIKTAKPCAKILDLCTGCGAIAIALAKNISGSCVTAVDISEKALDIAQKNATRNSVSIDFLQADVLLGMKNLEKFDIIVSNPPYIPTNDIKSLDIDVKDFEPLLALDGDDDGLLFYRKICENFKQNLHVNGNIFFEYGINQHDDVKKILENNEFYNIEIKTDLCGVYRIAQATI